MRWVCLPEDGVEDEDDAAVDHVPFVPVQVVNCIGNEAVALNTQAGKHGLLPEAGAAYITSEGVDDAESNNALDGSRDNT